MKDFSPPHMFPLTLDSVFIAYEERVLFKDLSLVIESGERVGITGPNGSGKSTLLRAILGLHAIESGSISFGGREFSQCSLAERSTGIGYLPQIYEQLPQLTALQFYEALWRVRYGKFSKSGMQQIEVVLSHFSIHPFVNTEMSLLSGGELRRVFLGAAFLRNPSLYLLDEPFVSLDREGAELLRSMLRRAFLSEGSEESILIVSHDTDFLADFCTTLYCVTNGVLLRTNAAAMRQVQTQLTQSGEWIQ